MIRYVIGIITDGERVLLAKKVDPLWPRGLFDGVGSRVIYGTPVSTVIEKCKEKTGLDILEWTELKTIDLPTVGSILTYFSSVITKDEIENVLNTSEYKDLALFDMKKLPNNIQSDLKHQIEDIICVKTKGCRTIKRLAQNIIYIFICAFFFILLMMVFGKISKGSYLYFVEIEGQKVEQNPTKKEEFKKGFSERINKGPY